jgi:hypothetical protein
MNGNFTKTAVTMMRTGFVVLTLAALMGQTGNAATSKRASARRAAYTSNTGAVAQKQSSHPIVLSVGPGFISGGWSLGFGLNAGAVMRVSDSVPIYAGLDTTLIIGSAYSAYSYSWIEDRYSGGSSIGVGLMGTAYYDFALPKKPNLHITGGMSIGPVIAGGVSLAVLVRPGFTFDISPTISITGEPVMGMMGGAFVFMPRALLGFRV